MINADKPDRWKADIASSLDLYNRWFIEFAPRAFQERRADTTIEVEAAIGDAGDLVVVDASLLRGHPELTRILRMSTAPPLAIDRLVGLAGTTRSVLDNLEKQRRLPPRMTACESGRHLERIAQTLREMLDLDVFPWLAEKRPAGESERRRAVSIVADRLCGSLTNPIIRNAQEERQLNVVRTFLEGSGYIEQPHPTGEPLEDMEAGTFAFRMNVVTAAGGRPVNVPCDVVIQPRRPTPDRMPVLVEAKSAGDFANTNKRRKEEATKVRQLRGTYGSGLQYILLLGGYFNAGYLGYEASEGIDWVWEHRIGDLSEAGL